MKNKLSVIAFIIVILIFSLGMAGKSNAQSITQQPTNQTVAVGGTAIFTVGFTGGPCRSLWYVNGVGHYGPYSDTPMSYSIPNVTTAMNGWQVQVNLYGCTGGSASPTSTKATLTVTAGATAPSITTQPVNQTVTAPASATFSVVASGTAPLSYQWSKNSSVISGATLSSYTTPATTTADSGSTFTVVVSNSAGSVTSNAASLTVNVPQVAPTITTQPASVTVAVGQTATFNVVATGTAPLAYQWRKNTANITGATSSGYTTPATTTADSGSMFDVIVSNSVGSVTSNAATLTVTAGAPQLSVSPSSLSFPAQQINTVAAPMWVTLTNNGTVSANLGAVVIGEVAGQPTTSWGLFPSPAIIGPIKPGGTTTFLVVWIPRATGVLNASLIIPVVGGATITVPISGTGQ